MYQQICGFLEGCMLSQLLYRDTPVPEDTLFTIHEGNGTGAASRVAISDIKGYETGVQTQSGDVEGFLPLGSGNDREFVRFSIVI